MQEKEEKLSTALGLRLREERERLSLSQADAALLGAVSREMWGRYERGAMPSAEVLLRVQGHGIDVNYVLGGSRLLSEGTLTEDETQLLGYFRATDNDGRQSVLRLARMECSRLDEPTHAYVVRQQTSTAVQLHEPAPDPVTKPARAPAAKKPPPR